MILCFDATQRRRRTRKQKKKEKRNMMVDRAMKPLYVVTCHVVMRAVAGASGSKGRSRKSPIIFAVPYRIETTDHV